MHHKAIWALTKRAARGYRGDPIATVAFYGPDDRRASKVAVTIVPSAGAPPVDLQRWFADTGDVRDDRNVAVAIQEFIEQRGAKSVVVTDRIIGCPHEEGVDYEGAECPQCPFWAGRDRWTGQQLR